MAHIPVIQVKRLDYCYQCTTDAGRRNTSEVLENVSVEFLNLPCVSYANLLLDLNGCQ